LLPEQVDKRPDRALVRKRQFLADC
jgi:hypothetical protein